MDCKLQVGQQVVMIESNMHKSWEEANVTLPEFNMTYTIRSVNIESFSDESCTTLHENVGVQLKEINNPSRIYHCANGSSKMREISFPYTWFKPLDKKEHKTSIEIFNKMLITRKEEVNV